MAMSRSAVQHEIHNINSKSAVKFAKANVVDVPASSLDALTPQPEKSLGPGSINQSVSCAGKSLLVHKEQA
eukprot:1453510-Karenia_brevis.AAC.1